MNLRKKIIGAIVTVLIVITNIVVFAQTEKKPQTTLAVEPKRTEAGIEYNLYLENTNCLSTLFFEMNFDGKNVGKATLKKNECFDILHTTWNTDNRISVKGYLGRTGNKMGFSSNERIKVAKIVIPIDVSSAGEFIADISNVICAGITETDGTAVKGEVKVYETSIKYSAKECSILDFSQDAVDILSSKAQNVDVIFAAYDENGKLVSAHKENVTLQQGKNKLDVSGIDFTNSESISVMVWDSMTSMRPLTDKTTINK